MIPELNRAIMALAPPHTINDRAPGTWREVKAASTVRHVQVWAGEADHSIYGDPRVNYAFRAWHDRCHLIGQFPFTIKGEESAVAMQCAELMRAYPRAPAAWASLITADVLGTVYHLHEHGAFAIDQDTLVHGILASVGGIAGFKPRQEIARFSLGV